MGLVERLAENAHNVWAAGRIKEGWTFGKASVSEHVLQIAREFPHMFVQKKKFFVTKFK